MKKEEIIEGLNTFLEEIRSDLNINDNGFFALQSSITQHPVFKSYKEYKYTLWYIRQSKKIKIIVESLTDKVITPSSEKEIIENLNIELSKSIFKFLYKHLDEIITGDIDDGIECK